HVRSDTKVQSGLEVDLNEWGQEYKRNVLEIVKSTKLKCRIHGVNKDDIVSHSAIRKRCIVDGVHHNRDKTEHAKHVSDINLVPRLVNEEDMVTSVGFELRHDQVQFGSSKADNAGEVKRAAVTKLRLDPHVTSHKVHETLGDGKAEAGAAKFPCG